MSQDALKSRIRSAVSGRAPLVFKHARVLNVYTEEIIPADVAVQDGLIIGIGEYSGEREIALNNQVIVPGLIDAHVHIESSPVTPRVPPLMPSCRVVSPP